MAPEPHRQCPDQAAVDQALLPAVVSREGLPERVPSLPAEAVGPEPLPQCRLQHPARMAEALARQAPVSQARPPRPADHADVARSATRPGPVNLRDHVALDALWLTLHRALFSRAFSMIEYVIRRRRLCQRGLEPDLVYDEALTAIGVTPVARPSPSLSPPS